MEGKVAGEGLQTIDEDDDMLSAMARELVQRNGIGEMADAVWSALNNGHHKLFPAQARAVGHVSLPDQADIAVSAHLVPADLVGAAIGASSVIPFGQEPQVCAWATARKNSSSRAGVAIQLGLIQAK